MRWSDASVSSRDRCTANCLAHTIFATRLVPHEATSRSGIATLSDADRLQVFTRIDALWASEPELQGHARAELPYITRVRRARRAV